MMVPGQNGDTLLIYPLTNNIKFNPNIERFWDFYPLILDWSMLNQIQTILIIEKGMYFCNAKFISMTISIHTQSHYSSFCKETFVFDAKFSHSKAFVN